MVQVPEINRDAVVPETVQTDVVVEAKETANPELEVAVNARFVPDVCAGMVGKVMVWLAW